MGRTAVVAHGSGSSPDLVRRAFEAPLAAAGIELVTWADRSGDIEVVTEHLGRLADELGPAVVGGISLGAHAAVRVAAARPWLEGLLLVLPAWTGPAADVAALSDLAADEIERDGLDAVLARTSGQGWVARELSLAWPSYGPAGLVACLRATARSAGPTEDELRALEVPAGVVAMARDAYHPLSVAQRWSELAPRSAVRLVTDPDVEADRATLGRAALDAWLAAQGSKR